MFKRWRLILRLLPYMRPYKGLAAVLVLLTALGAVFALFEPKLLAEVIATTPSATPINYKFDAFYGIPKPLDSETRPLSDYTGLPITIVEMHPQWIHDAQYEALLTLDVEVLFWMFSATVETFDAIEQYEPEMVVTSEARLMRRWLDR